MARLGACLGVFSPLVNTGNVTAVLVFVCTLLLLLSVRRRKGLPPGPALLPVVGNAFSLVSTDILKSLRSLRQTHGDIYSIYIGKQLTIVLNGYKTIHSALVKRGAIFSNRPSTRFTKEFLNHGIIFGAKHLWKQNRLLVQNGFQEFGFSTTALTMEDRIRRQVDTLLSLLDRQADAFNAEDMINKSLANVVSGIIFGKQFDFDDPVFHEYMQDVKNAAKLFGTANVLLEAFPWLRFVPGDLLNLKGIRHIYHRSEIVYTDSYESHKKRQDESDIKDFVDFYIRQMEQDGGSGSDRFTREELRGIQADIMGAGSETSASTIRWLLLYLLNDPAVQRKLHQHIDAVIGRDRPPSLTDRPQLPYVEAAICEALRISSPAPLAVPHTVDRDTDFEGFLFPANTTILVNLDSVLMDPNVWEEPQIFRPERFIDGDGQLDIPPEFIPFSVGRRSCIGESLARMELFLFVTSLLQRFEFRTLEGASPPEPAGILGLTYSPVPYMMCAVRRN